MYGIKDFLEVKATGGASFSPDSTHIAYLSNTTGTSQIFLVPISGGEPEQLTSFSDPVSFVQFSPAANELLFGKAKGGNEQTQLFLMDLATREIIEITSNPQARHNFGSWSSNGKHICFTSNERNGRDFDLYVMNIKTSEKRCIFDEGGWCVAEGFSPKDTFVVARKKYSRMNTDLYLCNLQDGSKERLSPHEGNGYYGGACWLPDESVLFLIEHSNREFNGLSRYSLAEKKFEYVFTPEWDVEDVAIDPSGKNVAIRVNEGGYDRAAIYDTKTFKPCSYQLPPGNVYRTTFSEDGTWMAFSLGDSRRTSDVWVLNLETGKSHQLTHSHQGVSPEALIEPELVHVASFDGLLIPTFMYRPRKIKIDSPTVIIIHGGPEAQYKPTYQPLVQYLVHRGYSVVAPNVRGSSGYGKSYMALDDVEKRLDAVKDMVALREYLASIPGIDATRIALYGESYGGFMALACLAFYPEYWAAGVDVVGIANFVTFLENTAPYRRKLREAEYGSLGENREFLERISPINSIKGIRAPLFIIHGANDPRVPVSEAEQIVYKLQELGHVVELVVYSDEGHGIERLKNKLDAYSKAVEFLDATVGRGSRAT